MQAQAFPSVLRCSRVVDRCSCYNLVVVFLCMLCIGSGVSLYWKRMHVVGVAKALSGFLVIIGDGADFPLLAVICDIVKRNVFIGR